MSIPYKINKIETRQFACFPEVFITSTEINVGSEFVFQQSIEKNKIICISKIRYQQADRLLLILELACVFDIAPDGMEELKRESKIPKGFLQYMASIVVGTARGVIHAKTEGSLLNPVVLPPINLVELIKDDISLLKKD